MDAFFGVSHNSHLPQGSRSLEAVTVAELYQKPNELGEELMKLLLLSLSTISP